MANDNNSGAAGLRSATSRAYYGAYLSAKSLIEGKDIAIPCKSKDLSEHAVVQRFLMGCKVTDAMKLGQKLSNLHEQRKNADYEMAMMECEDQGISQANVGIADTIMDLLQQCSPVAIKQQIRAGIIQYKRITSFS